MEEITIYKFQLEAIKNALRLTSHIHHCNKKETCFDRQVTQANNFAKNALDGKKDESVPYM